MPVMERCLVHVPRQTLSHLRVLEQIAAGGMGVVYRPHDEQLDRDVALKVLPPGILADDTGRNRFRKEAVALAKLNHPHIATIYEFDTQDGMNFIAMELVCGHACRAVRAVCSKQRLAANPGFWVLSFRTGGWEVIHVAFAELNPDSLLFLYVFAIDRFETARAGT
jgi:hypothetical protein